MTGLSTPAFRSARIALLAGAIGLVGTLVAHADPVAHLRAYISIETVNPPGNESEAAAYLADLLADLPSVEVRTLVSPGGRTSLYARLPATHPGGGALVLMHHIDVVPPGDGWSVPPFSGRIRDGRIWGRGAVDVKSLGIAHLEAISRLARSELSRHRDLVFLAVADEEAGGGEGVGWMLDAHPELFEGVAGVLNEGGANRVVHDRLQWWGLEVAQKRPLWLRITAYGRGGHGSTLMFDSATHRLVRGLAALTERPPSLRLDAVVEQYMKAVIPHENPSMADLLGRARAIVAAGDATSVLPPSWLTMLIDTIQVTRIETTDSINVIPSETRAYVDARLLPETDADALLAEIRGLLGAAMQVETLLEAPPSEPSPTDHPLYRTLDDVLSIRGPVVPAVIAGVTDSRYFRQHGIATYGFSPFALDPQVMRGVHAKDENIPVDEFLRGVEVMVRVAEAFVRAP